MHEIKIQDAALLGRGSLKLLTRWVFTAFYDPAMPAAQDLIQSPPNATEIFLLLEIPLLLSTNHPPAFHSPRTRLASDLCEAEDTQGLAEPSGRMELLGLSDLGEDGSGCAWRGCVCARTCVSHTWSGERRGRCWLDPSSSSPKASS